MRKTAVLICAMASLRVFGEWLGDDAIKSAATRWLAEDRIAQMTMKGLSAESVIPRGALRIVSLSPAGYIVFSGSDLTGPVISFSPNAYAEPEEGSPFYDMLAFSSESVEKSEAEGGERTEKWADLVGNRDGTWPEPSHLLSKASVEVSDSAVVIEPFVTTHWNQWQPWNDFCPIYDSDESGAYRGRCPCGCVATATAQQIAHFRWPWRTGRQDTWNHVLDTDGDGKYESNCQVRFDGNVPFDWDAMADSYQGFDNDSRGIIDESYRFPVARFFSWVDVITEMNFGKGGSGANFGWGANNAKDWYESITYFNVTSEYANASQAMKADIASGVPVNVSIPGHSIVAHGWAEEGRRAKTCYVYINYGWGGSNDGWYKLYDPKGESPIIAAYTGFRPKKMVQLEPLPKVCDGKVEVTWHVPDFHKNDILGFDVKAYGYTDMQDETCDFSGELGVASNPGRTYVVTDTGDSSGNADAYLYFQKWSNSTYDLPGERILTGSSILSYRVSSSGLLAHNYAEIQASFDGEEWQVVSTPQTNSTSWVEEEVFLGEHAGKRVRFRIKAENGAGTMCFDDFRYSDVIRYATLAMVQTGADARSCSLDGFRRGAEIGVTVTPVFAKGDGIESEKEYTRMAATDCTACAAPAIISIRGSDGMEIDEGLYRELGMGEDTLRVRCSPSVMELKAYPSHLTNMGDDDVTVEKVGSNEFLVRMDTSKAPRRQRMMLTLEASNQNGDTAYRDLSLRFDEPKVVAQLARWRKITSLADGKPVAAYTFDGSDTSNSGAGSFGLGGAGDHVTYEDSPLGRAMHHATSDGPWVSTALDMTNGWTILSVAKASVTNNGVIFAVGATWSGVSRSGFALVSCDKRTVKLSHWANRIYKSEITANVPGATEKYHAYAVRGNGTAVEFFVDGTEAGSIKLDALPDYGIQLFSIINGLASTKLKNGADEAIDDWRMYYSALPDSAIAAYTATLLQFDEEPAGVAVEEGGTVVPESWFAKYCPGKTITREQLLAKAANGRSVWECYVAGLDPADENDDLVADITFEDGVPKVSIANGGKTSRQYRIFGRKSLSHDETPVDVTDVEDLFAEGYEDLRFFHITAELP